jgi:hypothetical protein
MRREQVHPPPVIQSGSAAQQSSYPQSSPTNTLQPFDAIVYDYATKAWFTHRYLPKVN